MARRELYFLDANVLMYAIGKDHPYQQPCIQVLKQIETETIHVVTSVEILQEILHRYYSIRKYEVAAKAFANMKRLCEQIFPVLEADVDRAYRLLQEFPNLRVRDAIHAATILNNDLRRIISTDKHFDAIKGVVRVDPAKVGRRTPPPTPRTTAG